MYSTSSSSSARKCCSCRCLTFSRVYGFPPVPCISITCVSVYVFTHPRRGVFFFFCQSNSNRGTLAASLSERRTTAGQQVYYTIYRGLCCCAHLVCAHTAATTAAIAAARKTVSLAYYSYAYLHLLHSLRTVVARARLHTISTLLGVK